VAEATPAKRPRATGKRQLLSRWDETFLLLCALQAARLAARRGPAAAAVAAAEAEGCWGRLREELEELEGRLGDPGRSERALRERLAEQLGSARAALARAEQWQAERDSAALQQQQQQQQQQSGEEESAAIPESASHEIPLASEGLALPEVRPFETAPVRLPLGGLSNAVLATRFERPLAHILWTLRDDRD
jgi:hypothetical protein